MKNEELVTITKFFILHFFVFVRMADEKDADFSEISPFLKKIVIKK